MLIVQIFVLIGLCSLSQSQNRFMPNLPMGEYHIVYDKVFHCESTKNHSIKFNLYFDKTASNITEMKGNITFLIPYDDTLTMDAHFSSWGSTGGWIRNAHIIITKKACSSTKNLLGDVWLNAKKAFNVPTESCPIPVGTYTTSGLDLKKMEHHNFHKVFFYGKYKLAIRFKNVENKVVGCEGLEVNILRPWETPI